MPTLFDGGVHVHYGQVYVISGGDEPADMMLDAFRGQQNGLCGGAWPGMLFLITGLHTGTVPFRAELHYAEPALGDEWEDVVEVPFRPATDEVALMEWGGSGIRRLDLPSVDLRARYCARGTDIDERYLLQFWRAPPGPDRIVKQTTAQAAYWHDWVRHLPPAPPPPTAEEIAEQERKAADERATAALANEARMFWGGRLPSDQVRRAGASGSPLVRFDRALAEQIAAAEPATQRAIARWVARRAFDLAGLTSVAWVAPALDAVDQGETLPPPFDDTALAFRRLLVDPAVPQTTVTAPEGGPRNRSQQAAAFPAIWGAAEPDPLRAAYDALAAAIVAYGDEYPDLFRDLRRAFFT